jgi:nitrogen regulatory protein PII
MDYHLVTCIVERGRGEHVADEAIRAGAQGATICQGTGTGVRQRLGPTAGIIDPEKEVILVVTAASQTQVVFDSMVKAGRLREAGRGFAYVQPVLQAVGFLDAKTAVAR